MQLSKLLALAVKVDQLNYYQLLGVKPDADISEIRRAYHRRARSIHPDRFYEHPDPEIRRAVSTIFKRITEAYTVLRDPEKKELYDQKLREDPKHLRFTDEDLQELRQKKRISTGKTAKTRQLYQKAIELHQRGEIKTAIQNLKLASSFEPDNAHFKELLEKWSSELQTSHTQ